MKVFALIGFVVALIGFVLFFNERRKFDIWLQDGHTVITAQRPATSQRLTTNLPPLLKAYLKKVLAKAPTGSFVVLTQKGQFRMKPNEKMTSFSAKQYVSLTSPMFSWVANINMKSLNVSVCDRLIDNKGELQARLFSAITVAKGSGRQFLRGELLRYLAELPWYPLAILYQPKIEWVAVSPDKVTGTLSVNGVTATVEYRFGDDGLIQSIYVPDREMANGNRVDLKPWLGEFSEYKEREGVMVPLRGRVSWLLETGKFTYFDGKIDSYKIGGKPNF